jgi:hypothetical protein
MANARDEITHSNSDYGGMSWRDLPLKILHDVCQTALEKCKNVNTDISIRFANLKSESPFEKLTERKFLNSLLKQWFIRKWNNYVRQSNLPPKKKAKVCKCGGELLCAHCDRFAKVLSNKMDIDVQIQLVELTGRSTSPAFGRCQDIGMQTTSLETSEIGIQVLTSPSLVTLPIEPTSESPRDCDTSHIHQSGPFDLVFPEIAHTPPRIPGSSKNDPIEIKDEEEINMSEDEEEECTQKTPGVEAEEQFLFGTEMEKKEEYDHYLDDPNPWHNDLKKKLFPAQIIGFRWMADRHFKGGGIVGDCVGCGKVTT